MKTFTKHILLLALMLFGVAGAAWADHVPQKYTSAVNLSVLQTGDTLAEGASITYDIGNPGWERIMRVERYRAKKNGTLVTGIYGEEINNIDCTIGAGGVIIDGSNSFTPVTQSGDDGDAWVVTFLNVEVEGELIAINISGVLLPAPGPYAPALDTLTGNWNFLMPGSNMQLKVTYFEQPGLTWLYGTDTMPNAGLTVTRGFHADAIQNIMLQVSDTFNTAMRGHFELDQVSAPPAWESNTDNFLATDISNFVDNSSLTEEQVLTFPNPDPGENNVYLIYGFDGYAVKYVLFNGTNVRSESQGFTKSNIYYTIEYGAKIFYTTTTVVQGLTLRYGSSNPAVVSFSNPNDMTTFSLNGTGEADIYAVFDGDATFQYDSVAFHVTVNDPATLTLASEGNGTVAIEGVIPADTIYSNALTTQALFNQMTVVDNNGHNNAFGTWTFSTSSSNPYAIYTFINNLPGDDWLITPAFEVEAGTTYTISFDARRTSTNNELFEVKAASANTADALSAGSVVVGNTNPPRQFSHYTGTFTPTEDGTYYVGIHAISDANKNGIYVKNLNITRAVTIPGVVITAQANTYRVLPGTELTVNATPAANHYVASWSNDTAVDNRLGAAQTFTMPAENTTLSASFAQNPTLTLASNNGGEFEVVLPSSESKIFTASAPASGTRSNDTVQVTLEGQLDYSSTDGWQAEYGDGYHGSITVTAANGFTIESCKFKFSDGSSHTVTEAPFAVYPCCYMSSYQIYDQPNGQGNNIGSLGVLSIEVFYKAVPNVIAADTPNTYYVDYGTPVTVIATPDSVHYLATLGGVTMGSNTAVTTTVVMTAPVELEANFTLKPTLTLAHNDGGTLEAIVPQTEPVLLTTIIPTTTSISTGTWTNDTVTVTLAGQLALEENRWVALYGDGNQGSVSVTAAAGFSIDSCKFYINEDSYTVTAAPFAVYPFCDGSWQKVFTLPNAQGSEFWSGGVTRIEVYTTTRPNVIASSTPNTYYIDYNTSVTVKATPSDTAYLVRFVGDADTNSNVAVEKTYGPLTAALTTAEATFNDKPVLTLAQNESWGSVSVSGPVVWNNQIWGSWNSISTSFPQTIGDITINKNNFYCYYSSGKLLLSRSVDNNSYVTFTSAGDNFTRIEMTYTGGSNLEPANEWTCENGVAVWEGDAQSVTITNANNFYFTQIKFIRGSGIAQLTDNTYRVDYGTTLTVKADATDLHHVANWVNEDSVDYPAADITYSAYFITEPEPLFPDSSTLTLTLTADATAKALFGINSYDVVATAQLDDRAEIGTDTSMGYIAVSYIDIVGDAQTVAATDTAEITAQGGSASVFTVTPHYGYLFTGWSVTQNNQTTQSTQNPLTLTEAATVVARFVPDTFEVSTFTATPADTLASAGTVTGADRYAYRTLVTLEETPATGYHFVNWSNTERTALGTETTVTVQLMQDTAIFAVMDTNVYDITYTIQTDDRDEIGTNEPMGSVVLEGRHMHFLNDVLEATATYGYVFEGWYSNDELASTDNPFTFSPTEAVTYEARFLPDTFTVSLTMNDEHAGDVLPHGQLPAGVTVGPNVTYRVPYLVPMTFYGAAMEHNHIVNWINENDAEYVDGVTYSDYLVCDTFPTTSLLTLAVTGDTTVKINFLVDYYYVTVGLDEESTGRGTVTGSGYYDHGDTVTAMASPAEGYHFDGWDNGVEISPYAFAAVQDSTILVHFDTNVYSLTVVAETDTNTGLPMGTTLGDGLVKHFLYYDIEAVAEEGYHFVMWTDSVTDNPRTVTLTENTTFTAHFEMDPIVDVVINGVSADETMGTVSGSDTVDYGEEVILTATANEHYHFVQWNDGNSDNPRTVVAAHDSTLTAYFAVNQYAVVGVSADETMGTVSGSDTADYQSVVVLTATAGDCYHFESWSDGETANPRSIVAEADTTVSALFAANVYSMNDTVTVCDSYEWNGTVYTQSGTYTHDGTTAAGCDMLETLYLTVNASTTAVETVTACDSYEWHDSVYTASTDESTYQTTNAAGCDSTVTLHLIVNAATASEESETACNYYTWHGETYTVSGDYSYTTQNAAGCDSTVTLHLTVNYGNLISIDSTVCDSIVWRGNVYTESGVYDFDLPSESGCFSIETLNLTVNYSSSAVETIFACDSYTWNGLQFDADNHTATYFTVNAVGCDSTVMLDLTVHYSNEGTDNVTACDSVEWHGTVYTASDNTATYSTINAAGCDSTVVLVLTINHSVSDTVEVTAEESYEWNGEVYSQSGTYTYSGTTEAGCDSTVTLLLTITYQPQPVYYTVTLVSADTTMGSVLPAEAMSVEEGSQFSATAIALYGRHFVAWERDGQVVSTDNPYSFEVTEDVELTATFAYNPVTVILSVNNANWGSTDPAPGTYTYEVGEQATVTATPAEGFHMMGWTINGTVIETDETTYTVEATPEMAGMTFSVVAMFVRDIAIDDVEDGNIAVYASEGKIVVSGAEHRDVYVYDVTGRCVSRQADAAETVVFPVAQTGVYMVKIGNLPARKVALVR